MAHNNSYVTSVFPAARHHLGRSTTSLVRSGASSLLVKPCANVVINLYGLSYSLEYHRKTAVIFVFIIVQSVSLNK